MSRKLDHFFFVSQLGQIVCSPPCLRACSHTVRHSPQCRRACPTVVFPRPDPPSLSCDRSYQQEAPFHFWNQNVTLRHADNQVFRIIDTSVLGARAPALGSGAGELRPTGLEVGLAWNHTSSQYVRCGNPTGDRSLSSTLVPGGIGARTYDLFGLPNPPLSDSFFATRQIVLHIQMEVHSSSALQLSSSVQIRNCFEHPASEIHLVSGDEFTLLPNKARST